MYDSFYLNGMFTIDTNIIIAYLGGEENVISQIQEWKRHDRPLIISSITECEVLSFPRLSPLEEERAEKFLKENFIAFPFDGIRARYSAAVRRKITRLKLPDAAIASLALEMGTPLITRNIRDFKNIPGLQLINL